MSVHALPPWPAADPITQAKIDLAAAHRLAEDIIARVQAPPGNDRHPGGERTRLFFEAMKRILDRELPGYAD